MSFKVFNDKKNNHIEEPMFFGNSVNIARYDVVKYPIFEKQTEKMMGFFWRENETNVSKDIKDFKTMSAHHQHIFISNLQRQILLDAVQGRSIAFALTPWVSLPEMEPLIAWWQAFETLHSRAYTYIIRNVFPDPSLIFDEIMEKEEIVNKANSITKYYDDFIEYSTLMQSHGKGKHVINGEEIKLTMMELKTRFYRMIMSINILEGLRFYVSFACSWAFYESLGIMEGNSKLIKLICRDENMHLAITQTILKKLPEDDNDFNVIIAKEKDLVYKMFEEAVQEEKEWAKYLFKDGSIIGLNEELLCQYVEYMANKRLRTLGAKQVYEQKNNPLRWTAKYTESKNSQPPPQETEITSYLTGAINNNVEAGAFNDIKL